MSNYLEKAYEDFEKLSEQIITFCKTYSDPFADPKINELIDTVYTEHCHLGTRLKYELNNRSVKKERPKEEW